MSISTTELFEKLGTYCSLRMPFTFKNVFYYFSRVIAELTRGYEKFDLLYLNKASIFSENWDYSINHINKVLEQNARLTIEPVKRKFVQDSVKYLGYVVRKRSPAKLKVRAIVDLSILRNKTEVKVLGVAGYDRQYITMCSCLVAPFTEPLKRKSERGNIKGNSECPE
ncbi:retrovirus-related Pol polyprotein from transposon 297 [Trichonephila inaurata madagascariensis]|uniref:Retrovirus-related Pol polyprotein from transposon 297 n=1 Tax=Trichonephila inaurata madagascariensis TaxID=2747483 RepID=A0A8X7CST0_9ARAC|nr:retrovirus-related Pol polyprotein from transposon 297 [Trichonephila inaurata madagascariensis]